MTTLTYPSITAVAAKFRVAMVAGFVYRAGGNIRSCRETCMLLGQLGQCLSYYSLSQIRVAAAKMEKIETYWPQKYKNKKHISVGQKKQSNGCRSPYLGLWTTKPRLCFLQGVGMAGVLQAMLPTHVFSSQSFAKLSEADTLITWMVWENPFNCLEQTTNFHLSRLIHFWELRSDFWALFGSLP